MNWDLIIGLIIGLSGSIIGLVGAIITNKQNHEHQVIINRQNHEHEVKMNSQKQDFEKEIEIQRIALENSFKDFEAAIEFNGRESNGDVAKEKYYPYDMYLLMYMKIAEFMNQKDENKYAGLSFLLMDIEDIQNKYKEFDRTN